MRRTRRKSPRPTKAKRDSNRDGRGAISKAPGRPRKRRIAMKYMLLIAGGDPKLPQPSPAEGASMLAEFQKLGTEMAAQGKLVHSARLRPNDEARTVKVRPDRSKSVVDGPFTETKEAVGGYYMIDCASEAEAIEWARKFPPFFHIEVRQVWEM